MKTKFAPCVAALVGCAMLFVLTEASFADTSLTFAGPDVPNGLVTFTPENTSTFYVQPNLSDGKELEVQVVSDDLVQWWGVYFLSPWEGQLDEGEYMDWSGGNAFKPKEPTLGLWGMPDGPDYSKHSGWFNVLTEIEWNPDSTLQTAAIDFIYFGNKDFNKWTVGSFRYNSNIPVLIPEASQVSLFLIPSGLLLLRRRRC